MSFAGHTMDMINRIKQNRELLTDRRRKRQRIREIYRDVGAIQYESNRPVHRKITAEERKQIREQLRHEYRTLIRKRFVSLGIALILALGFFYLVVVGIDKYLMN